MEDSRYEAASIKEWLLRLILLCIPILNIVLLIKWSFFNDEDEGKQNFAKAQFIVCVVVGIFVFAISLFVGFSVATLNKALQTTYDDGWYPDDDYYYDDDYIEYYDDSEYDYSYTEEFDLDDSDYETDDSDNVLVFCDECDGQKLSMPSDFSTTGSVSTYSTEDFVITCADSYVDVDDLDSAYKNSSYAMSDMSEIRGMVINGAPGYVAYEVQDDSTLIHVYENIGCKHYLVIKINYFGTISSEMDIFELINDCGI